MTNKKKTYEEADLKSLVGLHKLSGVDSGANENCANTFSFKIDGKTYTATEDENDGYRSCMAMLEITNKPLSNKFPVHEVLGSFYGYSNMILEFRDVITGGIVLRVGTNNADDYYPCFVHEFNPQNLAMNANK